MSADRGDLLDAFKRKRAEVERRAWAGFSKGYILYVEDAYDRLRRRYAYPPARCDGCDRLLPGMSIREEARRKAKYARHQFRYESFVGYLIELHERAEGE
jgi:hypothetical protein